MRSERVRAAIEAECGALLASYDGFLKLADNMWEENERMVVLDPRRPSTQAVASLHGKGEKSASAIQLLVSEGYGQDAVIVARSLTNLAIDLGFICEADQDLRAAQWIAQGRIGRRRIAKTLGKTPQDDVKVADWAAVEGLAKAWKSVSIFERAKRSKLERLYEIPYRLGSSFEHSDSWGSASSLIWEGAAPSIVAGPSNMIVEIPLLIGIVAFAEVVLYSGRFFGFEFAGREQAIREISDLAFGKLTGP